jgi:hypothetical protein
MAADSVWIPAWNAQLLYAGSYLECMSLRSRLTGNKFYTTNNRGQGWTEHGISNRTKVISFTLPISEENAPGVPKEFDLVDATWEDETGDHSGKFRISSVERQGGGEGGYTWSYEGEFTGPVSGFAALAGGS